MNEEKFFIANKKIAMNIGLTYGTIWLIWVFVLVLYADSAYDSTGAFLPWWMNLNINNPVFMCVGFGYFIFFAWQSLRFRRSKEG